jgi:hypothetical protein
MVIQTVRPRVARGTVQLTMVSKARIAHVPFKAQKRRQGHDDLKVRGQDFRSRPFVPLDRRHCAEGWAHTSLEILTVQYRLLWKIGCVQGGYGILELRNT